MKEQGKTLSVPVAGRLYFDLGKNASYEAARRGEIPVIKIGSRLRVPIIALEKMLETASPLLALPDKAGRPRPFPDINEMGLSPKPKHHPHPPAAGKGPPIESERYRARNKFGQKSSAPECASHEGLSRETSATGSAA